MFSTNVLLSQFLDNERLIKWDKRFLDLARFVSQWSKDPSTKLGSVITRKDNVIVSVGYNGFPKQMYDDPELYANRDEKYSRIIHGEINALLHATQPLTGCTVYNYPLAPCDRCVVLLIQSGIKTFVFPAPDEEKKQRWGDALERSKKYIEECGCAWREYAY